MYGDGRFSGARGGSGGGDRVYGGAGGDHLDGSLKDDLIVGGTGRDVVRGLAGNDRIDLRDGVLDELQCGDGRDRPTLDDLDFFFRLVGGLCEDVRRSRPAAVVYFGDPKVAVSPSKPEVGLLTLGCSADVAGQCVGRARVIVDGRPGAWATVAIPSGQINDFSVGLDQTAWRRVRNLENRPATLQLEGTEPRGPRRSDRLLLNGN